MGILDRISESISETGQELKRKADQSSAKSQMHSELKRKEKELEALVYQIGMALVSNEPEFCSEKCGELYKQLVDTREAAKTLRNQISLAEMQAVCPGCGRIVQGSTQFCTFCGTRMPEINIDNAAEYALPNNKTVIQNQSGEICQKCGAPLKVGAAFCVNCGTPTPVPQADNQELNSFAEQPAEEVFESAGVCANCGAELQAGDAFCTNCGTPV